MTGAAPAEEEDDETFAQRTAAFSVLASMNEDGEDDDDGWASGD